jgi:hypothetical protein
MGSISSWIITVFLWIYVYTYLITELKKFAKLYQLTSFSPLRISVPQCDIGHGDIERILLMFGAFITWI